ncbi:MAG: imidazolonepropionase [Salibacteraceae bacterium]
MKLFIEISSLLQIRESSEEIVRGRQMDEIPSIENAWLAVNNGLIEDFGPMATLNQDRFNDYEIVSCKGQIILPTWVDSHTHLVFAQWREKEFEDRIQGLSYEEIAARGGGILNSARALDDASEETLYSEAMLRLNRLISMGTGAIEIKSGYGLSMDSELKMLRVIKRIKETAPIPVKSTFLGAHAFPEKYQNNKEGYVTEIIEDMLPEIKRQNLAEYIDVFCEKGYFDLDQTERILKAGKTIGLKAKVHVNQFNAFGGVKTSVDQRAISVDHLEELADNDVESLKASATIPVALPSCSFFLSIPYTPARRLMNANLPLALATDFNPGSTPSGNMNFVVSLACIKMGMTPNEAINAATLNGAAAIELSNEIGSITIGKRANLMVFNPGVNKAFIPYSFGQSSIDSVYINGEKIRT